MSNLSNNYKFTFKIVFVGNQDSGIIDYLKKYTNEFPFNKELTIGVVFYGKDLKIKNNAVHLQIWNITGKQSPEFLLLNYLKGANALVYLLNLSNNDFLKCINNIKELFYNKSDKNVVKIIFCMVSTKYKIKIINKNLLTVINQINPDIFYKIPLNNYRKINKSIKKLTKYLYRRYNN